MIGDSVAAWANLYCGSTSSVGNGAPGRALAGGAGGGAGFGSIVGAGGVASASAGDGEGAAVCSASGAGFVSCGGGGDSAFCSCAAGCCDSCGAPTFGDGSALGAGAVVLSSGDSRFAFSWVAALGASFAGFSSSG